MPNKPEALQPRSLADATRLRRAGAQAFGSGHRRRVHRL